MSNENKQGESFPNTIKRLAVFGGSFNPIHLGHLMIAQAALEQLSLDRILFVPARVPPHKEFTCLIPDQARLSLIKMAIKDNHLFLVTDAELHREGPSYSIDTIHLIKEQFPAAELFYLIGADLVSDLHTWKDIDQLCEMVQFIAAPRNNETLVHSGGIEVQAINSPMVTISSSGIREMLRKNISPRYLLPNNVFQEICARRYYSDT